MLKYGPGGSVPVRYLSLCSGIEAASVAWQPLGWEAVAVSEVEPFPCAVLALHFPHVPNLGDMTKIDGAKYHGAVDLVVAGTPCQDFSIAGKRAGLAGKRSGLALEFVRILSEVRPLWFIWENVPGVFSTNGGRDFGTFLRALDYIGYSCAWRVLDAQFFGVPQRRRRVFVVGHLGDWRPAAAVLFERESCGGDTPAHKKTGQDVAATIKGGTGSRGWENGAECTYIPSIVGQAISCKWSKGTSGPAGDEHHNLLAVPKEMCVSQYGDTAAALTSEGADASPCADRGPTIIATAMGALAFKERGGCPSGGKGFLGKIGRSFTLQPHDTQAIFSGAQVRRLTPRECERLQGFPDDYTAIEYRGKPAADGPHYKALGNSMAVPVMRWLGERISRWMKNNSRSSRPLRASTCVIQ